MSALTLTLRTPLPGRLDLSPLGAALAEDASPKALSSLVLALGNQRVALGELFDVAGDTPGELVLRGDLGRVDGIGAGLAGGTVRVEGHAGAWLGQDLSGGRIVVEGNVGDYAGAAMRKGSIEVLGNAGDYLGGALPGAMKGMAGGQVVIRGSVGARCGDRMRRGAILIGGHLGEYAGTRMLAGTLLALEGCGAHAGYGMKRGTLLVRGAVPIDATFADCGRHTLPIVHLLFRSWRSLGGSFADLAAEVRPVQRWLGDRATDGKGEILCFE